MKASGPWIYFLKVIEMLSTVFTRKSAYDRKERLPRISVPLLKWNICWALPSFDKQYLKGVHVWELHKKFYGTANLACSAIILLKIMVFYTLF